MLAFESLSETLGGSCTPRPHQYNHAAVEVEVTPGMLATQGRLRGLLRANAAVAADLSLPVLLRHIVDAARNLLRARYAAVGVNGRGGQLQQFVQAGRLLDADDSVVGEVATFLRDLLAAGKTASTLRSYGSAAVVAVSDRGGCPLESCDPGGGKGFQLLDSADQ